MAIIGGGIMGSVLAERLSSDGHSAVILDRRGPGTGSTAASTADIMWAMDVPLCELAQRLGLTEAGRRWRRVYQAVCAFADRIDELGIDCARCDRSTLYLAGRKLGPEGLLRECKLHRQSKLPTAFLSPDQVSAKFGIVRRAGLLSEGGFDVDPVRLSHGLLETARSRIRVSAILST